MNEIIQFEFENKEVRTEIINGEPYFCLIDACKILEIQNSSKVMERFKKDGLTSSEVIDTIGRKQSVTFINEKNLYRLILKSRKKEAERFSDWITDDVLPQIRKTGHYSNQEQYQIPKTLSEALRLGAELAEKNEKLLLENSEMKPKADFYDDVAGSKDAIDLGTVAKILDKDIGRNKLFQFLREKKVLMTNNQPMQKYVDCEYFRVIEQKYNLPTGETRINIKTLVYQKCVEFINKLLKGDR